MNVSDRHIAHLDLDTFFVSVERLRDDRLRGKPVIIGGTSDRGVVASCSYEARRYGVRSAMPMRTARMLCPEAVLIRGDMDNYSRYSGMVTQIIAEEAPVYEKASIDEHYLDLTGMDRFFGTWKWVHNLRQRIIGETGLPISLGLSVNKTISKIATGEAKPNGELEVIRDRIPDFLSPLSIAKIPMIGEKTYRLLRSMGIATIDTLCRMQPEMLEKVLGKNGIIIWQKANGIDNSEVVPYSERKSISSETTFETDTTDVHMIRSLLTSMVEKLAFELRCKEKLTSCITVKIRYSDFDTHSLQQRIAYTSFDHTLIRLAHQLFGRLYQRRVLIRLVGVKFSHLVHGTQQLDMFEDIPEKVNLYLAMDRIRKRYGEDSVCRAASLWSRRRKQQEKSGTG